MPDPQLLRTRIALLLRVDNVELSDNFFDLGGDSLAALELAEVLSSGYGREVSLEAILEAPTFGDLFRQLDGAATAHTESCGSP